MVRSRDKIDKIVGFHDATRLATLHNSAMHGPLTYLINQGVCVCVCLCVYSRVGASYVGRPICVCAVSAPLRRVNIYINQGLGPVVI